VTATKEVREYLKKPAFNNWQWDDAEMIMLLRQMFLDLDFLRKFEIEVVFSFHCNFLCSVIFFSLSSLLIKLKTAFINLFITPTVQNK